MARERLFQSMMFAVCGPPAPSTPFAARLAGAVLREAFGGVRSVYVSNALELRDIGLEGEKRPVLVHCDFPDNRLSRFLLEIRPPALFVIEPFEDVVPYAMRAYGISFTEGLRLAARSATLRHLLARSGSVITLAPTGSRRGLASAVGELAAAWGVTLTDDQVAAVVLEYGGRGSAPGEGPSVGEAVLSGDEKALAPGLGAKTLPAEEARILGPLAIGYDALQAGRSVETMVWPGSLFTVNEKPYSPVAGFLPMLGPARILTFGPYLTLTAGPWSAEIRFSVRRNLSGNILLTDIIAGGTPIAAGRAELPEDGSFSVVLDFAVGADEPPIEVRTTMLAGAIEGELELVAVAMRMRTDGAGTAPAGAAFRG